MSCTGCRYHGDRNKTEKQKQYPGLPGRNKIEQGEHSHTGTYFPVIIKVSEQVAGSRFAAVRWLPEFFRTKRPGCPVIREIWD
jgi:hypothetical protein